MQTIMTMTQKVYSALWGRPKRFSLLLGLLAGLGFAPLYILPLTLLGFAGLYKLCTQTKSSKHAALYGFLFAFGLFLSSHWWIGGAFRYTGSSLAYIALPFALGALLAYMSLFAAAACGLWHKICTRSGCFSPLLFALLWLTFAVLRGELFYGFPWGYIGYTLTFHPFVMAPAAFAGVWGLSFLVIWLGVSLSSLPNSLKVTPIVLVCFVLSVLAMPDLQAAKTIPATIINPNVPQGVKWSPAQRYDQIEHLRILTKQSPTELVVWPETALPVMLTHPQEVLTQLRQETGKDIITGIVRGEVLETGNILFFNAIFSSQQQTGTHGYDKNILVPFGEFMPLANLWPKGVRNLVQGGQTYQAGQEVNLLPLEQAKALPLVCYEATFPSFVLRHSSQADILLNLTNDAWFAGTTGPAQHFAMAKLRAVETGKPMLRVANRGYSAVITPTGKVLYLLRPNKNHSQQVQIPLYTHRAPLFQLFDIKT